MKGSKVFNGCVSPYTTLSLSATNVPKGKENEAENKTISTDPPNCSLHGQTICPLI